MNLMAKYSTIKEYKHACLLILWEKSHVYGFSIVSGRYAALNNLFLIIYIKYKCFLKKCYQALRIFEYFIHTNRFAGQFSSKKVNHYLMQHLQEFMNYKSTSIYTKEIEIICSRKCRWIGKILRESNFNFSIEKLKWAGRKYWEIGDGILR